ncbi:MAG: hypothetical protein MJ077_00225 [Oscillospiraceae bacterium]|nr:hypothetical protein [Oscillospiraceae bacterium]
MLHLPIVVLMVFILLCLTKNATILTKKSNAYKRKNCVGDILPTQLLFAIVCFFIGYQFGDGNHTVPAAPLGGVIRFLFFFGALFHGNPFFHENFLSGRMEGRKNPSCGWGWQMAGKRKNPFALLQKGF